MNCPTCGSDTDDIATKLQIADRWWTIEDIPKNGTHFVRDADVTVKMVVPPELPEYDSYGETISQEIFMVVEVNGRFFKKEGRSDSYGGRDWNGPCREVKAEPKTVVVFDYV